jgi:multidrug resistance efflux pump
METLPQIPLSPRVVWRQFRQRFLPVCVFALLVTVAATLWVRLGTAPALSGLAEGVRATVSSPQSGLIVEFRVRPYQLVNQGDVIAVLQPGDPRLPLDLLQTSLQLSRLRHEPTLAQRNAMDYERVRVDHIRLKSELAVARVNLVRANDDLNRNRTLFTEKVISEELFSGYLATRDAFQAEVTVKEHSVAELEGRLRELRELGDPSLPQSDTNRHWAQELAAAQVQAVSNWNSLVLQAPISGMVAPIYRQVGEQVAAGEPVAIIQSLKSDRIIAYLRQPYPLDPTVGMAVRITTRERTRQQLIAAITHVGPQVETITNALAFVRQGSLMDVGLPLIFDLPPQNRIRPGELVDITFVPAAN